MLWAEGHTVAPPLDRGEYGAFGPPSELRELTANDLQQRYDELAPKGQVDPNYRLPQALRNCTASAVRSLYGNEAKIPDHRLWVFTSGKELRLADGTSDFSRKRAPLLSRTPVLTPYNRTK